MKSMKQEIYVFRILPGEDLKNRLLSFAKEKNLKAAYIITCVGSLTQAHIRTANTKEGTTWIQKMEIVSLVGTLFHEGCHLHISLADETGRMIGGHVLEGCKIYTTAEVVVGEAHALEFKRDYDPNTKHKELVVQSSDSARY